MVQFLFTNKDVESLKGLYRIMANGFVSSTLPSLFCMSLIVSVMQWSSDTCRLSAGFPSVQ